jgi:hypothetical protein
MNCCELLSDRVGNGMNGLIKIERLKRSSGKVKITPFRRV